MIGRAMILGALALGLAGCTSNYFHVKDPTTGRNYYTRMIWDKPGGGISFEDAATGLDVTLQNSEVRHISAEQYDAVRRAGSERTDDVGYTYNEDDVHSHPAAGTIPQPDKQVNAPYQSYGD